MAKILIVDDHPDLTEIMAEAFERAGHNARGAKCGREALAISSDFQPEIVFLDINLPDMSGLDVAVQLRAQDRALISLVCISGWSEPSHRLASAKAGFDQHMGKPFTMAQLNDVIERATAGLVPHQ